MPEIDTALTIFREAEAAYCETCDEIMEIEGGHRLPSRRKDLPGLEAMAATQRAALADATRLLDEVAGMAVAKMLRMDYVDRAIAAITRATCKQCGARAIMGNDCIVLLCKKCTRRKERQNAPAAEIEEDVVSDETTEIRTTIVTEQPAESAVPLARAAAPEPNVLAQSVASAPETSDPATLGVIGTVAALVSVDDAKLPSIEETEPRIERADDVSKTSGQALEALVAAHSAYEAAYAALMSADPNDGRDGVLVARDGVLVAREGLWIDLVDADARVSAARAAALKVVTGCPTPAIARRATVVCDERPALTGKDSGKAKAPKTVDVKKTLVSKKPTGKTPSGADFAGWLKAARASTGLSQVVFGEKIGASETQMWN